MYYHTHTNPPQVPPQHQTDAKVCDLANVYVIASLLTPLPKADCIPGVQ